MLGPRNHALRRSQCVPPSHRQLGRVSSGKQHYLARTWLFGRLSPLSEPLVGLCNQQQDLLGFGIGHCLGRRERFYGERSPFSTCRHRSPPSSQPYGCQEMPSKWCKQGVRHHGRCFHQLFPLRLQHRTNSCRSFGGSGGRALVGHQSQRRRQFHRGNSETTRRCQGRHRDLVCALHHFDLCQKRSLYSVAVEETDCDSNRGPRLRGASRWLPGATHGLGRRSQTD